jgi:CrcB protein
VSPLSPIVLASVAAGGAAGSVARYLVSIGAVGLGFSSFWGTLAVNVAGSFMIGLLAELFVRETVPLALRPLLITGFLGGFTTFSAFSLEVVALWREGIPYALVYVAASVMLSVAACLGGVMLVRASA